MSVEYKDYYQILGVTRGATADEIKKSYRKMATKFHPDRHHGDRKMEEKFKEINEAYEVLKDADKRRQYDALGANWRQGQRFDPNDLNNMFGGAFGGAQGRGRRPGPGGTTYQYETNGGPGAGGFSDFFESLFGGLGGAGRGGAHPFGGAMGGQPGTSRGPEDLFGEARPRRAHEAGASGDVETALTISLREAYRGTTRSISFQRAEPNGQVTRQNYDVKIPAGILDGQKIRLKGQGSQIGHQTGDILITVHLAADERFTLEGSDLIADLALTSWEAALGEKIAIETLDGPVEVKVPAGIRPGQRLRVRNHGFPRKGGLKGDLLLKVSIHVPAHLTEQERELYEKLRTVSRFNPRGA
jgi:curved DNA-binding protein